MNQRTSQHIKDIFTSPTALVAYAGITCFTFAILSIYFANKSHYAAIWVVNAILLIFIFRSRASLTWQYFTIGLLANIVANYLSGATTLTAITYASANSIEVLIPILSIHRNNDEPIYLSGFNQVTTMIAIAIPAGCLTSAILATIMTVGLRWDTSAAIIAFSWFTIDLLAMMAIVPLGLACTKDRVKKLLLPGKLTELAIVIAIAMSITVISTRYEQIRFIMILMPLLYAAFKLGVVGTCLTCFSISSVYTLNIIAINTNTQYSTMPELISYSFLLMCITLVPALIIAILIDQRNNMESALHESEQRWKFSLEGGSQGTWDWDINLNNMYYSHMWITMLGHEEGDITNSPDEWLSRIHPDESQEFYKNLQEHLSGEKDEFICEHRMRCKDGNYKWFLGRGKVIMRTPDNKAARLIGTYTDIDNIKKAEEETEKLSQRLQLAIDAGKIGIFNFDIVTNILTWDERMFEIYDVKQNEFTHNFHAWESRVHPDDYQRALAEFNQAITGSSVFDTQFRVLLTNGKTRWIAAKAHVLRDAKGNATTMLGMNWDVTNEKLMMHELYTEKERLSTTLKAIGDAVIVTDELGIITFINPIAEQLIGCQAHIAIGKRLYENCKIISELTGELLENPIDICLQKRQTHYFKEEGILINHIGSRYYIQDSAAPIILPTGEIAGCVLVLQDVTTNRNLQAELKHQATHDVLTGLLNRREIELKLKALIGDARTSKNTNSFYFVDLDNFKTVNDNAGHAAGDELLRRVAEMLCDNVRTTDTVARLGGDEFAIILPDCTQENAITLGNNLIDKIKNYRFVWDHHTYVIGASIGLVNFKPKSMSFEELLSRADAACYTAKNLGGNRISTYEGSENLHK